jgi:hypothetical protein
MIRADQDRGVQEIGRADHGQRDVADQGNTVVERVELGDRLFDGTLNIERTEFALGYSTFGLYGSSSIWVGSCPGRLIVWRALIVDDGSLRM